MKVELAFWLGGAAYFFVIAAIYAATGGDSPGIVLLILTAALGGLVAGWIFAWRRKQSDPTRAQDRPEADADDDTGPVGTYPSASLRPLALGGAISIAAMGVVVGSWLTIIGVAIVASQVALLVRDAER
ncbi:hypothetical protein BH24ACT5_BH24ACT5_07160 [soil metagenome]